MSFFYDLDKSKLKLDERVVVYIGDAGRSVVRFDNYSISQYSGDYGFRVKELYSKKKCLARRLLNNIFKSFDTPSSMFP